MGLEEIVENEKYFSRPMQAYCGRWKKNSLGMIFDIKMGLFFPKYIFKIVYNDANIKLSSYIHEGHWHWPPARYEYLVSIHLIQVL